MQRYPDLRLRVMSSGSVRDMHVSGADVNIRIGEVADSSLVQRPLATFRFGVYGSDSYLHTHGIPGHPQELLQHRCLIHKSPRSATLAPWNQWDYARGKERGTVTVPDAFVTDDREALLVAAQGGAGLFRIGMFSPRLLAAGGLVRVMADWQWPGGPKLSILYRKQSPQPRRIAVFIEFMMATVASFDPLEVTLVHR
jgi:DNA-binding transcriptional LysR family regulator